MRLEYRVVWKRRGMHQKSKRYATLRGAQDRATFLGPEPWLALRRDPDEVFCCTSYECGCEGVTVREHLLAARTTPNGNDPDSSGMPPIEYIRIEQRPVSPWQPHNVTPAARREA